MDAKPQKRHRASKQEWQEIRDAFSEDRCWVCNERWAELHHILNRSHSGDDVVANLVPVCRNCHGLIEARDPVARSRIRQALMPSNLAYLRLKLGENIEGWLSRHYAPHVALDLDLGLDLGVALKRQSKVTRRKTLEPLARTDVA
jgi:hypothetical protein